MSCTNDDQMGVMECETFEFNVLLQIVQEGVQSPIVCKRCTEPEDTNVLYL